MQKIYQICGFVWLMMLLAGPAWAFEHYVNTVQDQQGNAIPGVRVTVYLAGTTTLADLFSDDGFTMKGNPFTNASNGVYDFYAPNGTYDLNFYRAGTDFTSANVAYTGVVLYDPMGGAATLGLDGNFDVGPEINGATSANPVIIGNGVQKVDIGGDPTIGGFIRPNPLGDATFNCWTGFNCLIVDRATGATVLTINPAAGSKNATYQYGANYKPFLSFPVPLEPRGAATAASESLTTNVPKQRYMTVTDANTDAVDFSFVVTARMAGATSMTFRLIGVSNNAAPSGNIDFDCAAYTYTPGTDTIAAHSTTGEVTATLTPATQYRPVAVTTAAHTINGGPLVEGDLVLGSCEVDATATTSAQMTNFRLYDNINISLSINSWSD